MFMSHFDFELPSDFTRQDEFLKFTNHPLYAGEGIGQYCQKVPIHWVIRLWEKLDRDADRKEAATRVIDFHAQLAIGIEDPSDEERMRVRNAHCRLMLRYNRRIYPQTREFGDEVPDDTMLFAEICERPRVEFWWLKKNTIIRLRALRDPDFRDELLRGDWD